jgi:hypothetical protein
MNGGGMSTENEGPVGKKETDLYHHGTISRLFPSNNMGLVRTESGREVPFSYQLVVMIGPIKNPNDLNEGEEIGYDLGWTSNGLRVTKIRTF